MQVLQVLGCQSVAEVGQVALVVVEELPFFRNWFFLQQQKDWKKKKFSVNREVLKVLILMRKKGTVKQTLFHQLYMVRRS